MVEMVLMLAAGAVAVWAICVGARALLEDDL